MASSEEIGDAIKTARINGCENLAIFHCISSYPAPLNQINISAIPALKIKFGVEVGLSDHTLGNLASIVATSVGATIIEKHFTLSRDEGGVDSSFSLEPDEMKRLVEETRSAHTALGSSTDIRSEAESNNRVFRRSLYFVNDIRKGDKITDKHVRRIRPGYGLAAKYYDQVIGAICLSDAKKGDRVDFAHFTTP